MSEWIGELRATPKKTNTVPFKLYSKPEDMSKCVWAFSKKGELKSISKETVASILAEKYPDTIYFVAIMVTHPDYEK